MRHYCLGKQAHHCKAPRIPKNNNVDTAGIERKKMPLPGEVSQTTGWLYGEVSRGHSTRGKRGVIYYIGLTNGEGL